MDCFSRERDTERLWKNGWCHWCLFLPTSYQHDLPGGVWNDPGRSKATDPHFDDMGRSVSELEHDGPTGCGASWRTTRIGPPRSSCVLKLVAASCSTAVFWLIWIKWVVDVLLHLRSYQIFSDLLRSSCIFTSFYIILPLSTNKIGPLSRGRWATASFHNENPHAHASALEKHPVALWSLGIAVKFQHGSRFLGYSQSSSISNDGMFHEINHPAIKGPMAMKTPTLS